MLFQSYKISHGFALQPNCSKYFEGFNSHAMSSLIKLIYSCVTFCQASFWKPNSMKSYVAYVFSWLFWSLKISWCNMRSAWLKSVFGVWMISICVVCYWIIGYLTRVTRASFTKGQVFESRKCPILLINYNIELPGPIFYSKWQPG